MTCDVVIGLDIGTTSSKALARPTAPGGTCYVEQPTPWRIPGQTEIDPYRLLEVAVELIGRAVRASESAWGPVRVRSIGVTGLGESGVLLDAAGRPAAPVIAWFDHRGGYELEQAGREFPGFAARRSSARLVFAGRARPAWPSCCGYAPADIRSVRPRPG